MCLLEGVWRVWFLKVNWWIWWTNSRAVCPPMVGEIQPKRLRLSKFQGWIFAPSQPLDNWCSGPASSDANVDLLDLNYVSKSGKLMKAHQCITMFVIIVIVVPKTLSRRTFARDVQELLADLEARLAAAAGPVAMDVIEWYCNGFQWYWMVLSGIVWYGWTFHEIHKFDEWWWMHFCVLYFQFRRISEYIYIYMSECMDEFPWTTCSGERCRLCRCKFHVFMCESDMLPRREVVKAKAHSGT